MKTSWRVLGIDDGPFVFGDEYAPVIGVLCRGPTYVEAIMRSRVRVDGSDSTDVLVEMVGKSGYLEQVCAVILDGASVGGFNVFDIEVMSKELSVPVMTVSRKEPDLQSIENALRKHFDDWQRRYDILSKGWVERIVNNGVGLYVKTAGIDLPEAGTIIRHFTVQGGLPEPLRLAHMIGTIQRKEITSGRA